MMDKGITAHCLVKNEEVFVRAAIQSVIDFVDEIIVFDTGSVDATVPIIEDLMRQYPGKIIFEKKGSSDKKRHTDLRQEMVECTKTEWFFILDGDEIWPKRTMDEAAVLMKKPGIECLIARFYLCVGDIFHTVRKSGQVDILGKKDFHYPRFIKNVHGVHWSGDYNEDTLLNDKGEVFFQHHNTAALVLSYWHVTHLRRSSLDDDVYSSGGNRKDKRRETYFFIGKKILESAPEVFGKNAKKKYGLSFEQSVWNFVKLCWRRKYL